MPWFLSAVRPDIWHKNWFSLQIRRIHRAKAFLEFNWPFWLLFCITKSGLETFRYNQVNLWAINSAIQKQTILPLKHINFGFCKKINIIIAILPCFSYSEKNTFQKVSLIMNICQSLKDCPHLTNCMVVKKAQLFL